MSIFSLYSIKQKQTKVCGLHKIFSRIFKILKFKRMYLSDNGTLKSLPDQEYMSYLGFFLWVLLVLGFSILSILIRWYNITIHILQPTIIEFNSRAFVYSWYLIIFLYFLWSDCYFLKYSFLKFGRFLIMKTIFSYFPGMFENPAPAVKTGCKRNINLKKYKIKNIVKYQHTNASKKNRWL